MHFFQKNIILIGIFFQLGLVPVYIIYILHNTIFTTITAHIHRLLECRALPRQLLQYSRVITRISIREVNNKQQTTGQYCNKKQKQQKFYIIYILQNLIQKTKHFLFYSLQLQQRTDTVLHAHLGNLVGRRQAAGPARCANLAHPGVR